MCKIKKLRKETKKMWNEEQKNIREQKSVDCLKRKIEIKGKERVKAMKKKQKKRII